jgi:PAS domain S-box-containing protein
MGKFPAGKRLLNSGSPVLRAAVVLPALVALKLLLQPIQSINSFFFLALNLVLLLAGALLSGFWGAIVTGLCVSAIDLLQQDNLLSVSPASPVFSAVAVAASYLMIGGLAGYARDLGRRLKGETRRRMRLQEQLTVSQDSHGAHPSNTAAALEKEEDFRVLAENAKDAVLILTEKGLPLYASEKAVQLLGYQLNELSASNVGKLINGQDCTDTGGAHDGRLENVENPGSGKIYLPGGNGRRIPVKVQRIAAVWKGEPAVIAILHETNGRIDRENQLQNRNKRLQVLNGIKQDILAMLPLEQISQSTVTQLLSLVPCLVASVIKFDFENREMQVLAVSSSFPVPQEAWTPIPMASYRNIRQRIDPFFRGQTVSIDCLQECSPLPPLFAHFRERGARSCLEVPLLCQSELMGILCLGFDSPDTFNNQHVECIREVASSVAIAFQNARLFNAVDEHLEHFRVLATRLSEIDESERQRLVRELHDQVGQNLTALSMNLNIIRCLLPEKTEGEISSRFADSQRLIEINMKLLRSVISELRPEVLEDYGLFAALRLFGSSFSERTGIAVTVQGGELTRRLSPSQETMMFRVAQEALANVARHAHTDRALVSLEQVAYKVLLTISDKGRGFDLAAVYETAEQKPWGLIIMKERAEAAGGRFRIESSPGSGTSVYVAVNVNIYERKDRPG